MEKIKVLPVYPAVPKTFWSYNRALDYIGKKATMPPLGLLTALGLLPKKDFYAQRVIDMNVEPLLDKELENCDVVFASAMAIQSDSLEEVIEKAHAAGKKVVGGGPFPTSYQERCFEMGLDYIVSGEAEITLPAFLEDFVHGKAEKIYAPENVRVRIEVPVAQNGKPLLKSTPLPRWDLINLDKYAMAALQYSRGCPFNCEFCDITKLFGKITRVKSPEQMLGEFDVLYEAGYRGEIFVVDDNFIGNKSELDKFLPRLIAWQKEKGYPLSFGTEASVNLAWPDNKILLDEMVDAGFTDVFLGIESVDPKMIEVMNKGQNKKMNPLEGVRKIQEAGLEVKAGFIIGSDGERPEVFGEIYNFAQESGIPVVMAGLLSVIDGTDLQKRLRAENRLRDTQRGSNTYEFSLSFEPKLSKGFAEEELIEGYARLVEKLYSPESYFERCDVLRDNRGRFKQKHSPKLGDFKTLGKIICGQFTGDFSFAGTKYLGKTLVKKPSYFLQALTDVVKFNHFRDVTRDALRAHAYTGEVNKWYVKFERKTEKILEKHPSNLEKAYKKISQGKERMVKKAQKKFEKIHEDFNHRPKDLLENIKKKVGKFVQEHHPHSEKKPTNEGDHQP